MSEDKALNNQSVDAQLTTPREHDVITYLKQAISLLGMYGDTKEDPRIKAITKTKIEEALLWANHIYEPIQRD